MLTLNDTGVFFWEILKNDTNREEMLAKILEEYDVLEHIALADSEELLASWLSVGIVEE